MEEKNEDYLKERYVLAMERIHRICEEETVPAPFCVFFGRTAQFLVQMEELKRVIDSGEAMPIRFASGRS